jgi:hypothetical protein
VIVDYSFWRPQGPHELPDVNGVIRYLSRDTTKATNVAELAGLWGAGIETALAFEDAAERAAQGAAAGDEDGRFCLAKMRALGVPQHRPLYAAVDFDVPDYAPASASPLAKLGPAGAYLIAFGKALDPGYGWGAYGGYWLVSRCWEAGLTKRLWQTSAWSPNGKPFPHVSLYQPGVSVFGGHADLDLAGVRDWGGFRRAVVWLTGRDA